MKLKPEELDDLEGEYKKPVLGEPYYKLTPYQYEKLFKAAEASIQESKTNEVVKKENLELKNENVKLNKWVNYYLGNAEEKAIEKYGAENEELKNKNSRLRKENVELKKENSILKSKNASLKFAKMNDKIKTHFIKDNGLVKDYKDYFDTLPNNAKNPDNEDALTNALESAETRQRKVRKKSIDKLV